MPRVVLVFEVADHDPRFEYGPGVAVQALAVSCVGLLLYGRKLWETMSSHWPTGDQQPGATPAQVELAETAAGPGISDNMFRLRESFRDGDP